MESLGVICLSDVIEPLYRVEDSVAIVGAEEADPYEDKISNESPEGAGLMGASKGQTVEIEVPMGLLRYKVLDIKR